MIFHVTKKEAWEKAICNGFYATSSLKSEGFIHTSNLHQVKGVLERYYKNEDDLILLHIDEDLLTATLKFELSESLNEIFPHIFGPLNLEAVIKTESL